MDLLMSLKTKNTQTISKVQKDNTTLPVKIKDKVVKDQNAENNMSPESYSVALGLFLKAYLQVHYDNLSAEQILAITTRKLYMQAEHVSKKFETTEEETSHDKIMENAIYLLENSKNIDEAVLEYQRAFMAGFSQEKRKKTGAVYTPPQIIQWIHDKLEEYSPISLNKTYWDPACGTGRFPIDWYNRLLKHWTENQDKYPELDSIEKAHRHIIEKCLHFSDIDQFAIRLCKLALYLKCPQVTDLKFNVTCEDTLLMEWPKGWPEKFDYVAGNPPYTELRKIEKDDPVWVNNLRFRFSDVSCSSTHLSDLFYVMGASRSIFLSYITQDSIAIAECGSKIRPTLKSRAIDYNYSEEVKDVFKDNQSAGIDCIIIVLGKENNEVDIWREIQESIKSSGEIISTEQQLVLNKMGIQNKRIDRIINGIDIATANKKDSSLEISSIGEVSWLDSRDGEVDKYKVQSKKKFLSYSVVPKRVEEWNFVKSKIITRTYQKTHKVVFSYTEEEVIGANYSLFCIEIGEPKVFLPILNSRVIHFWMIKKCERRKTNRELLQTKLNDYRNIPLPDNVPEEIRAQLIQLCDKMLLNPNDKETEAEINKIVYELYNLTPDEIKIIETELGC